MSWQQDMKDEKQRILNYAEDLEAKLKVAMKRLSLVASDIQAAEDKAPAGWPASTYLRNTAARGLEIIANMQQRSRY
jgi:hypothetical protein